MTENNKHWTNVIEVFEDTNIWKLRDKLNEFFKGRFVIATQIFPEYREVKTHWTAIVYFKEKPESS